MIEVIKKYWKKVVLIILVVLIGIGVYIFFNPNINNIPIGEYIESLKSPDKNYILNSYKYSGGATMDWTLRVEVVDNKTKKAKNIYWNYHEESAKMEWIDNENVKINGKKLNIHKDKYDFRVN